MNNRVILFLILLCFLISGCGVQKKVANERVAVRELLGYPFGTLLTMEVMVVDGYNTYHLKEYSDMCLLKVIRVEGKEVSDNVVMVFKDETRKLRQTEYEAEGKNDKYVGKTFKIVAYESGGFVGVPAGYFEHQPLKAEIGFHFEHYLVVVADLTD